MTSYFLMFASSAPAVANVTDPIKDSKKRIKLCILSLTVCRPHSYVPCSERFFVLHLNNLPGCVHTWSLLRIQQQNNASGSITATFPISDFVFLLLSTREWKIEGPVCAGNSCKNSCCYLDVLIYIFVVDL